MTEHKLEFLSVQIIHDMVRNGRMTAHVGAMLLQLRAELKYARKPWWERALRFVGRVVFG
jgi:hypothetical protein